MSFMMSILITILPACVLLLFGLVVIAKRKAKDNVSHANYAVQGLLVGAVVGGIIYAVAKIPLATCMPTAVLAGMLVGVMIPRKEDEEE